MDEIKINVPEGMEIDKENSTFECIKFKKKIDFTPKKGDFIYITTTGNHWYLCIFDHMDGTVIDGYLIQYDGGRDDVQTKTLPIVRMESVSDIKPASYSQLQNMLDRIDKKGYEWSDGRIRMKLPKTWDEFCETHPIRRSDERFIDSFSNICDKWGDSKRTVRVDKNLLPNRETAEAFLALMQLVQLRDCYNDGWTPNWKDNYEYKFSIINRDENVEIFTSINVSAPLAFKTAELRDQFLENFRDLIEIAKPLI